MIGLKKNIKPKTIDIPDSMYTSMIPIDVNLKAMFAYAKSNNKRIEDLTSVEIKQFEKKTI